MFIQWTRRDDYPECDTILCMNNLHHFGNLDFRKPALEKVPYGTEVVFEISKSQKEMMKSLLDIFEQENSRQENRVLFLTTRR